jgi:hypothetical protein
MASVVRGFGVRRRRARSLVSLLCAAVMLAAISAPPAWARLPTAYSTIKCTDSSCSSFRDVFEVKPRVIVLKNYQGGTLKLRWSSWTSSAARGAGKSYTHTTQAIRVRLSRPKRGTFTRLKLYYSTGQTAVLRLGREGSGYAWLDS